MVRHVWHMCLSTEFTHWLSSPYLGYKDKTQDEGGANEEPSAEKSSKSINKILQGVGGDNDDCQHNAGHIDGCCNVLGIIQAFNLHFACRES